MLPVTPPKLGRYEIVDEIGKGAMGVVFLARDPLIGRLVALKTFRIGYSVRDQELEQFRIRFMREAQSAGILSHPHIVTIHDVVEQTDEGLAFIAMEYVRGTNLKSLLQSDQPMSFNFIADIMDQVADALDYAHAHRVIHRDVKPANILITSDNRVKITDFGIARLDTSNLTQEGQLLGTPNYMAPEQIQGKEIDHRADLFALGVVLYEMLTRHKPFQGENLTVVSHRIVYDHFTPPKDYAKDLPAGIERILDRALEKDPGRRYQRAKDLADDLRRELAEVSRDDLNETLSIASWAPGTGPASPGQPPPPGVGTTVSAAFGGGAPVPVAKAEKPPRPPKPKGVRPPFSSRRLAISAGVAALVTVLAAVALLLGISWTGAGEKARIDPASDAATARYMELIKQGQANMRTARFADALMTFQQARQVAPANEKQRVGLLVQAAEDRLADYMKGLSLVDKIAAYVATATLALEDERFTDAVAAADAVLVLDADNADAIRIRAEANKGIDRLRKRPQIADRQPAAREPVALSTPRQVEPSPAQAQTTAAPGQARLRIVFHSQGPSATVRIDLKNKTLVQQIFKGKRAFFRRTEPFSGEAIVDIPTGIHDLQILVAPANKPGWTDKRSGNFPGGETRSLEIQISEAGVVSAELR